MTTHCRCRHPGNNLLYQMRGHLRHTPSRTGRTQEAALLAAEGKERIGIPNGIVALALPERNPENALGASPRRPPAAALAGGDGGVRSAQSSLPQQLEARRSTWQYAVWTCRPGWVRLKLRFPGVRASGRLVGESPGGECQMAL